jgi:hypothetical protein
VRLKPDSEAASAMIMGLPIAAEKYFSEIRRPFCAIPRLACAETILNPTANGFRLVGANPNMGCHTATLIEPARCAA